MDASEIDRQDDVPLDGFRKKNIQKRTERNHGISDKDMMGSAVLLKSVTLYFRLSGSKKLII